MNVYCKPTVNQMMSEDVFNQSLQEVECKISAWGQRELALSGFLLASFVEQKVEEYKRSFIQIEMPFHTEVECQAYLDDFYHEYAEVIKLFPYDRWVWVKKLEVIQYGPYDIQCVHVPSQVLDHKEFPLG